MKSTKYQVLKDDFDFARKELGRRRLRIEQLEKEKKQAYYDGYRQGRLDEKKKQMNK